MDNIAKYVDAVQVCSRDQAGALLDELAGLFRRSDDGLRGAVSDTILRVGRREKLRSVVAYLAFEWDLHREQGREGLAADCWDAIGIVGRLLLECETPERAGEIAERVQRAAVAEVVR